MFTITRSGLNRRSFLMSAGAAAAGMAMLPGSRRALGAAHDNGHGHLKRGDIDILRFLAAAELFETDLWQQYNELASGNPAFNEALENIDEDNPDYIDQNTANEDSHQSFINAFLEAHGGLPVNLDQFRTLPSSEATGAKDIGRLTNLTQLTVDTSWYNRYRGKGNPDLGDSFAQVVNIVDRPAIPLHDNYTDNEIQAIADTAAWHFPMVEQGGASLYIAMAGNSHEPLTLNIVSSIGGAEAAYYSLWRDVLSNLVPVDSGDGLVFDTPPDPEDVLPSPCAFISETLPLCSIIRPTSVELAGAQAALQFHTNTGLFIGQSQKFFDFMQGLAEAADRANG
jgi:hypothetical protein